MKKIEAIIRHERLQEVQDALDQLGVSGLTVSEVVGCGRQKGYTEQYRGSAGEHLAAAEDQGGVRGALGPRRRARSRRSSPRRRTGDVGDGRVFVYDVDQSIRIRTGEHGEDSVRHEEPVGWGH